MPSFVLGFGLVIRRRSSGVTGGGATGARGEARDGAPQCEDRFRVAMESLHVSAVPKSLPCRTEQRDILLHFLRSNVKSGEGWTWIESYDWTMTVVMVLLLLMAVMVVMGDEFSLCFLVAHRGSGERHVRVGHARDREDGYGS